MILDVIRALKEVVLHKQSKMTAIHKALNVCKLLKDELDFENQNQLKVYQYIAERRFQGESYSDILIDVNQQLPGFLEEAIKITEELTIEDLEERVKILTKYEQSKKVDTIADSLRKSLNEFELEEFPSISEVMSVVRSAGVNVPNVRIV